MYKKKLGISTKSREIKNMKNIRQFEKRKKNQETAEEKKSVTFINEEHVIPDTNYYDV